MFDANDPNPTEPFFLIVADHDRGVFCVEGPMTDDRPWEAAARFARSNAAPHRVRSGRHGSRHTRRRIPPRAQNLAGVPPGSILRPMRMTDQLPAIVQPGALTTPDRHLYSAGADRRRRRRRRLALRRILHRQHPQPAHAPGLRPRVRPVLRLVRAIAA